MKNFILFLICFLASPSYAFNPLVVCSGSPPSGTCNYDVCSSGCTLFSWDGSTTDVSSNVCSLGDTSATLVGEVNVASGYVDITDDTANGVDYYRFDISSFDIWPAGEVTVEATINFSTISNAGIIFQISIDADNFFLMSFNTAAGNDVSVSHRGNATTVTQVFDVNLSTSTSYSLVATCSPTSGMSLSINGGSSWTDYSAKTTNTMTTGTSANGFRVGNSTANSLIGTMDDIKVKSGFKAGY